MGKSAKFYKRPSRKEKEGIALKKLADPAPGVAKTQKNKATAVQVAKTTITKAAAMDVDLPVVKKKAASKVDDKPDYVDLLSGKKTFKKFPKRK
ncbi:hypothetical protein DFQ28_002554 [Apophysomyces sp. BC1034]|nr:hypothetical protein DFQ30_006820 [Apophysomyces sp. BC1015]KAG0179111.1 hypothetical protein DFQ29_002501 [Apophysomyces sp. BC1021]KAG0193906.1 hypothetical protein DFQ28_002554 [Apophysomyces sp. BC1034]